MTATVTTLPVTEAFWGERPILSHIATFARARRVPPWGVLGVVLAHGVAAVEPNVMIPPLVGSAASLNLFVGLVGESGNGKGASEGAARDAVQFVDHAGFPIFIDEFPLGSGEGIARTFQPASSEDGDDERVTRAVFSAPEVDTLGSLAGRSGSTLMPELRKLAMGEQIGFGNASKKTRCVVPAHTYRASLVVGVQPERAGQLLDDAGGGTPQRFLWLPTVDRDAPDVKPDEPAQAVVMLPRWGSGTVHLSVPEAAEELVHRNRLAQLRGEPGLDPLAGHRTLTRLKVAAALMILDGRSIVDDDDWRLSGSVMAKSDSTRARIESILAEKARSSNVARAVASGEREVIKGDVIEEAEIRRTREGVLRKLNASATFLSASQIRRTLTNQLRQHAPRVIQELVDEGSIMVRNDLYGIER